MGRKVHFNVARKVPDTAVALAVAVKETATPQNTLDIIDRSADIQENVTTKFEWRKYIRKGVSPYYYDTWTDDETGQTGVLPVIPSGKLDQYLVTNISVFPGASGKLPIPLPYYYDLKFDHWSGTDNPEEYIRITDEFGNKLEYVYFKVDKSTNTYYENRGGTFAEVGSFVLGSSRLSCQAALTALGLNKWLEPWGTSTIDSHRAWEDSNPQYRYPPWQLNTSYDHMLGQDTITEGAPGFHNPIDKDTAIAGEYYVTASGFWAAGDDSIGEYIADTDIQHPDGTSWGEPIGAGTASGPFHPGVAADLPQVGADATIGELLSEDLLGGVGFIAAASGSAVGAYRIRIYIPEDIVDRPEQTFWVQYNRFNHPKNIEFGYKEIINSIQLNKENRDYTLDYETPSQPKVRAVANGGLAIGSPFQEEFAYIKRRDTERIYLINPDSTERQSWFLRVHNGAFHVGERIVDVNDVPTGDISGLETHNVFYHIPELDTGNYYAMNWANPSGALAGHGTHTMFEGLSSYETPCLGKVIKERPKIIDDYTIQLKNTPIYFWDGDYGKDEDTGNQIGGGQFSYYTNSYPLYTPPNIIDHDLDHAGYVPDGSELSTHPKNSHGINIYINDELLDNTKILQWDFFNGIIRLSERIRPDDDIQVTYLYHQTFVIGNYLDLSPIFNHFGGDLVGEVIRIVIKPDWEENGHSYYLDTLDLSTHKLAWHLLRENRTGDYSYDFINASGTVGFNLVTDTTNPTGAVALPKNTLVLGDIIIKEHNIDDTTFLDARVRGGGIKSDEWFTEIDHANRPDLPPDSNARRRRNKESDYYWDIAYHDGLPYQAEGVLVIKIPLSKRESLKNEIVESRYAFTNIPPEYKEAVDSYYSTNGTFYGAYSSVTSGLSSINSYDKAIMSSVRDYIDLHTRAYEDADQRIMKTIDKHIALGTFYVIVDENNTLWPIQYRR